MIKMYLAISILVGAILVIDGILLRKANGKCGGSILLTVTTSIEFLWVVVSVIALAKLNISGWLALIPLAYIAHNVLGWLYGTFILSKSETNIENKTIYVPLWYVNFGLSFGAVFGLASMAAIIAKYS